VLGITREEMSGLRSASEPYARLVARRVREQLGATWGSPRPARADRPAIATATRRPRLLALSGPVELVTTLETGSSDREANMWRFARAALELLLSAMR